MPCWVYIIQSQTTGRYYCGHSSDPERRLRQHNDPQYSLSKTTKRFSGPWEIIWKHSCENRGQAMQVERTIKKRGIGRYLLKLNRQSPASGGIVLLITGSCPGSHFDAKRARSIRTCPLLAFREPQGPEFDRRAQGLGPGKKKRGEMVLSLPRARRGACGKAYPF
jgi:putative endonuclease